MAIPNISRSPFLSAFDAKPVSQPVARPPPPPPPPPRFADTFHSGATQAPRGGTAPVLTPGWQPVRAKETASVQFKPPPQTKPPPEVDLTGLRDSDRADFHDRADNDLYALQVGTQQYSFYDVNQDGKLTAGVDQIQGANERQPRTVTEEDLAQVQPLVLASGSEAAREAWLTGTFEPFAQANGITLTAEECQAIIDLPPDQFAMFAHTHGQLEQLAAGDITPADYTFNTMDYAATLTNDGDHYVDLVGFAFSEPQTQGQSGSGDSTVVNSANGFMEWGRILLGGGGDPVGSILERLNKNIVPSVDAFAAEGHSTGFLGPVRDGLGADGSWMDGGSTIPHHFGEFLQVGAHLGPSGLDWLAQESQDFIDNGNYGDVRSGYFAIMIGDGLGTSGANTHVLGHGSSVLSPQDAALLTRWAYTDPAAESLWPSDPASGEESDMRGAFELETWVEAYNAAHPNAPISLND